MKKVLIIGSGGREHAIAHKLSLSTNVSEVIVAPGNIGMLTSSDKIKIKDIAADNCSQLLSYVLEAKIDLTVVGPEATLSLGIVDLFREKDLLIVGPTKSASLLETSKAFAKKVMIEAGVPTAVYREFFNSKDALAFIENYDLEKMVVKCDGLAAGKGVIVCLSKKEAIDAVNSLMCQKLLGENVSHIIIEEFLEGVEVSAFALCDGNSFSFLGTACDHKRLRDGDIGPNTGGMGVFSPASVFSNDDEIWVNENVFAPMLLEMKKRNTPFSGILFAGLMKTIKGWSVLEFNVRFGDPETQVLLPLISDDIYPWFKAAASEKLAEYQKTNQNKSPAKYNLKGVHVVMAAFGYPGTEGIAVRNGDAITFDHNFKLKDNCFLYFAGVKKKDDDDTLQTSGGRILGVTAIDESIKEARTKVYDLVSQIKFSGSHYRKDIGSEKAK